MGPWTITLAVETARPLVADLLLLLAFAAGAAMLLRRMGLSTIPAYLICGAIIGPSALGLIQSNANVESISGLAMVLLMFTIGLHLDPSSMHGGMITTLAAGVVCTLGVALVSWPFGLAAGLSTWGALAVGMALSMSSTAVVLSLLQQKREMHRIHGRLCVGISITQDLLSLVFMAMLPVMAQWAGAKAPSAASAGMHAHDAFLIPDGVPAVIKALVAVGGIAALIVVGRLLMPRLLREAAAGKSADVPLVLTAAAALGAAVMASGLGFSPELGAFLAGFILSGTPFRAQLAGQLSPMRDLFMAVFFTSVGLKLQLGELASVSGVSTVLIGLVAILAVKAVVIGATVWAFGATAPVAALVGFTLAQAGEFSIVVLTPALALGLVPSSDYAIVIAIVVLSLVVTPMLYAVAVKLGPALAKLPLAGWSKSDVLRERATGHEHGPHGQVSMTGGTPMARYVIIAGYGVVGRALADRFSIAGVPFCIVDLNRQTIETQRSLGRTAIYGDISNAEVLESAGIHHADAVLLTIPDDDATLRACEAIRRHSPDVYIAARTSFLAKAMVAQALGADHVTVEEVATAETMARQVLQQLQRRADARVAAASSRGAP